MDGTTVHTSRELQVHLGAVPAKRNYVETLNASGQTRRVARSAESGDLLKAMKIFRWAEAGGER